MSIKDFLSRIKGSTGVIKPKRDFSVIIFSVIIVLVATASFGLGRISENEDSKQGVFIDKGNIHIQNTKDKNINTVNTGGTVVASKNSDKYHFPWCSGAVRISEENKIWFSSIKEARAKGYIPASNCKGLK